MQIITLDFPPYGRKFTAKCQENSEIQRLISVHGQKSSIEFCYFPSVRTLIQQIAPHYCY